MTKNFVCLSAMFALFIFLIQPSNTTYGAENWVNYLSLADYTGPSGLDTSIQNATEDYTKYLNDKGGVEGVKIKFIGIDTRADVARVVSAYKRYQKFPMTPVFWNNSTPSNKVIIPMATRDKKVMITPGSGEAAVMRSIAFVANPSYQDGFGAFLDYVVKDWQKKGKAGKPTIGRIHLDNAFGYEEMLGGKEYAEKLGLEIRSEYFPVGTPDHTTYLTRLKGYNYILVGGVDPTPSMVIRDAYRLGMTEETQFFCGYYGPTRGSGYGIAHHNKELQGVIVMRFFLSGTEIAAHPLVSRIWTTYRKKPIGDLNGMYGWGVALGMTFEAALKAALKEVGYEKIDGEVMYRAYQKLTGLEFGGLLTPCTYSPTERRYTRGVKFYRVTGMDLVPITGWIDCPDTVSLHKF